MIRVTVAYALPDRQWLLPVELAEGATLAQALAASGIERKVPGFDPAAHAFGVYYQTCGLEHVLADGDRVEIYRPLLCDPKDVRRRRAAVDRGR